MPQKKRRMHHALARALKTKALPDPGIPYSRNAAVLEHLISLILRRAGRALSVSEIHLAAQVLRLEPSRINDLEVEITDLAVYTSLRGMESKGRVRMNTRHGTSFFFEFRLS